jgi:hypothetical protein
MKGLFVLFWLIGGLVLASCTGKMDKKIDAPADLIHRDSMVNIIADLMRMDAIVFFEQRKGTIIKTNDISLYLHNSIMEKYEITRKQFEDSFNYYQHDMEEFDRLIADVITRLTILKTEAEKS